MSYVELDTKLHQKARAAETLLVRIAREHRPAALANSFGVEDMVLTDMVCRLGLDIEIFSLDTGRLPGETYELMQQVQDRYERSIRVLCPDTAAVETFATAEGVNAFYRSIDLRKRCCGIRKVEPLERALSGKSAWLTGLRREQAPTRTHLAAEEWDEAYAIAKFNPLVDWSVDDVWNYVRAFQVPYNVLHDRGFPSIGCAPCTRAISVGEDVRAGRWWWEDPDTRECGLHVRPGAAVKG